MMKLPINGYTAYIIQENEDGYYLSDCHGYVMEKDQLLGILVGLLNYAELHENDLINHNIKRDIEIEKELRYYDYKNNPKQKTNPKGYVYLMECGGKYKIGFSKDVERRIKELNHRPFETKLLAKSRLIENPYSFEQEIHEVFEEYRIDGEWYNFEENILQYVINVIKNTGDE